jgi:hypothetical protein
MNQTADLQNLRNLLEQEKFEEAKSLLENYFSQPLDSKEEKNAYLNVVDIYLDVATHFAKQKKQLMESALGTLESLDSREKKLSDFIDLESLRGKIQGL